MTQTSADAVVQCRLHLYNPCVPTPGHRCLLKRKAQVSPQGNSGMSGQLVEVDMRSQKRFTSASGLSGPAHAESDEKGLTAHKH